MQLLKQHPCPWPCSFYWLGLKVTARPSFGWLDPVAPPLDTDAYQHWGQLDGMQVEPNNRELPPEDCVVANVSQAYGGAWGWADVNCGFSFISICKISGKTWAWSS